MKRFLVALLFAVIAFGGAALAQKKGPNGGDMVTVEGHPIEFVAKDLDIVFYIIDDDGTLLATKTVTGRAVVQDGGKTTTITLTPAEPNKLVGKLQAPLASKARVVLSARIPGHTLQARFTTN